MIKLEPLPYDINALEPIISTKTIEYHYGKHHAGYVKTVCDLIDKTPMAQMDLEILIITASSNNVLSKLFNNAAQVWNHQFYWNSLAPTKKKTKPSKNLQQAIERDFGSTQDCVNRLIETGLNQFGSGWVWLAKENGILKVFSTSNAQTPLTQYGLKPLLCLDVWEHAYYLDYQNNRKEYLTQIANNLINWEFASSNFQKD